MPLASAAVDGRGRLPSDGQKLGLLGRGLADRSMSFTRRKAEHARSTCQTAGQAVLGQASQLWYLVHTLLALLYVILKLAYTEVSAWPSPLTVFPTFRSL